MHEQKNIQMFSDSIRRYELPSFYVQSIGHINSAQRNAIINFVKSIKGRNMIFWGLDGKIFSNEVLNRFRKWTVNLLKSIDSELKAQNLHIE